MQWKQQCEGYAIYRWSTDSGAIEVQGKGFPKYSESHSRTKNMVSFYKKYGYIMNKYVEEVNIPLSWIVAIVSIESAGNEWACAECVTHLPDGRRWCSYAPDRCGGGIAKDGKNYSCCAYGLMQVTDVNAKRYGLEHGAKLLGNPDESIRVGVSIYKSLIDRSEGDPLIAVRRYNGCGKTICVGGKVTKCSESCMFGIGGQGNYAQIFAHVVNTFVYMRNALPTPLEPPGAHEPPEPSKALPVVYDAGVAPSLPGLALAIGVGLSTYWYFSKRGF